MKLSTIRSSEVFCLIAAALAVTCTNIDHAVLAKQQQRQQQQQRRPQNSIVPLRRLNNGQQQQQRRRRRRNTHRKPPVTSSSFAQEEGAAAQPFLLPLAVAEAVAAVRGGACSDTTPALFFKIAATTLAESVALFGILYGAAAFASVQRSSWLPLPLPLPSVFGQSLITLMAGFVVVFGSSFVGALVDGGLSAATNQALNPNEIAGDPDWYRNLKKPSWNPPGYVFPIMWLIVSKPTQLCALSRIFKFGIDGSSSGVGVGVGVEGAPAQLPLSKESVRALAVYATHLALGDAWNKVFFGLECIGLGTLVISIFYAALLVGTKLFFSIDAGAGYYLLPSCGWVGVATALQYSIYFRNNNKKKK